MLKVINRQIVIGVWGVALVALAVGGSLSGVTITTGTGIFLLIACIVPPAVMLMVWRGAPPPTVAEIIYAADRRE